jgi:hypothetical protein
MHYVELLEIRTRQVPTKNAVSIVSVYMRKDLLDILRAHAKADRRSVSNLITTHLTERFKERPKQRATA